MHPKYGCNSYVVCGRQGATSEGEGCDSDGNGDKQLMELSDSSPCQRSEKHKPVEREADLAALLLAKEPFTMEKLVPTVEDTYFRFFQECVGWESERVSPFYFGMMMVNLDVILPTIFAGCI